MKKQPSILPYLPLNEHVNGSAEKLPEFNREFFNNNVDLDEFYKNLYAYIDSGVKATYDAHIKFKEIQSMFKSKSMVNRFELAQTKNNTFMLYDKKNKTFIRLSKKVVRTWYQNYLK